MGDRHHEGQQAGGLAGGETTLLQPADAKCLLHNSLAHTFETVSWQEQQCSRDSQLRSAAKAAAAPLWPCPAAPKPSKPMWATTCHTSCTWLLFEMGSACEAATKLQGPPTLLMRNLSTPCATGSSVRANLVKGDTRMSAVAASCRGPDLRLRVTSSSVLEPYWQ